MRWLVRTVTRKRKGTVAHSDESYVGDTLSIGRGAGQAVFLSDLRVALEHAKIVPLKGRRFRVESQIAAGVRVDGKLQHAAGAGIGSRIEIGDSLIRLIKAPKGYDAAVEISAAEQSTAARASVKDRRQALTLERTWLSKRGFSWLLLIATLGFGLVLPIAGYYIPPLQTVLRNTPLPDDRFWQAGALHSAHHFFGEDCGNCHRRPFEPVQDPACTTCHANTRAHADASFFDLPALTTTRCAACHKDHNGANGLVRTDQKLCQHCHVDLNRTTANKTTLQDVFDFGVDHPQFSVELAGWDNAGNYRPRREPLNSMTLVEDSQLKFPHQVHLDPEGLSAPAGKRILNCQDCHRSEPGGAKMIPIEFGSMCQDCHRLAFDPQNPERQVPHGKVAEVLFTLEEFYANKALVGGYEDVTAPAVVRQRRRPGQSLSRSETQEALAWARGKSRRVGQDLFEGQACSVCHRVSTSGTGATTTWNIAPVRVAGQWFEKARFVHDRHATMACASCHDAAQSKSSDDVLIPDIENCRGCHAGENARGKVASTCISCHRYHIFDAGVAQSIPANALAVDTEERRP